MEYNEGRGLVPLILSDTGKLNRFIKHLETDIGTILFSINPHLIHSERVDQFIEHVEKNA